MSATAVLPIDWCEKHRPRTLDDLVGNGKAIEELRAWAEGWQEGTPAKERAVILAGDPGIGKTSAALALASDMKWGVIEMNASDTRNEEVVKRIAGAGASNRAFGADGTFTRESGGRQLVVLDEADNLFGREDRGGMKAIVEVIREAKQPIVLIVNDLYELQRRNSSLKTLARTIKFTKVHSNSIPPAIRRIAQKEGVTLEPGVDKAIAERAGGDMRSAVNDLQALALGRTEVTLADVEAMGRRDKTGDIWELLGKVFYGSSLDEARKASWDLDETPDNIALWIDENIPVMYTNPVDRAQAYAVLSKAALFLSRVQRRQQYGLWSYATELMTGGVAVAKRERPSGARFAFPSWLSKQSRFKGVRELRKSTALKVGAVLHTSARRAYQDIFPYLRALMKDDEGFSAWVAWQFDLEAEELAFLLEAKPTSPEVKRILEDSQKRFSVPSRATSGAFGRFGAAAEPELDEDDAEEPVAKPVVADDEDEEEAPAKPAGKRAAKAADAAPAKKAAEEKPADKPAPKKQRSLGEF
ncbi:MAG TPA: replication factor C large subunit [Candidatus Thermoplasmatota archaeon]|nr:replication factor C large subunit [Candidatus Thermoplasmatota archaeon]